jgi:pimeloyl-ACP methyl ester carboxylesterase
MLKRVLLWWETQLVLSGYEILMFTSQILQKNKSQTVFLLHGLFATAGFWVPALRYLLDYRIVLLNIDYSKFFSSPNGLSSLEEYLRDPKLGLDDKVHIIGHSFGSVLVASLALPAAQRYHLCPIFLAEHADMAAFAHEVVTRVPKCANVQLDSWTQLQLAFGLAQKIDISAIANRGDYFLIPDSDIFFRYGAVPAGALSSFYPGDHFEVVGALSSLFNA